MFNVLLVDDEASVLDALLNSIAWQQFGVDQLLTASDGQSALAILAKQKVDLLITDIRMPRMDGIELIREIRQNNPSLHCILLTAYSEFSYAKAALQLGVENYLLKPFHKEELEETIERALENIYANLHSTDTLFRDNILLRWLTGSISPDELCERSSLLNINVYLPYYCVISMRKSRKDITLASYRADCARVLADKYELYRVHDLHDRHYFILGGSSIVSDALLDFFRQKAQEHHLQDFFLSIGPVVTGSDQLSYSYHASVHWLETPEQSIFPPYFHVSDETSSAGSDLFLSSLLSAFQLEVSPLRQEQFTQLIASLSMMPQNNPLTRLKTVLIQFFSQEFPNHPELLRELNTQILTLYDTLYPSSPTETLQLILEKSYLLYQYSLNHLNPIVRLALEYIHHNYAAGLSIRDFCAANKISANYLGFLFKQETGVFFNNYLLQYRLCKSLGLLQNSSLKIGEIAEQTGFSTASYFIASFRKQMGMSPIQYRRLIHLEDD